MTYSANIDQIDTNLIRRRMRQLGLNQAALGHRADCHRQTIAKVLTGRIASKTVMQSIAQSLDLPLEQLCKSEVKSDPLASYRFYT